VNRYGRRAASRSVVGSCRTVLANSTASAEGRTAARLGSGRVSPAFCFVLRSGISWQILPHELGVWIGDDVLVSGARLATGVWDLIHFALLDWLARDDQIDWSRAVVDSCSIRAVYGGDQTGPNPTDRAKRGSKRHLICDGRGVPLAVRLTGADRNDSQEALALVDAIPPLHGARGRPRQRPDCVLGDRGYDAAAIRCVLRARHIEPWVANAPHQARERAGPVALGRRAYVCLAESIPPPPRPL
jgi:transposase